MQMALGIRNRTFTSDRVTIMIISTGETVFHKSGFFSLSGFVHRSKGTLI